MDVCMSLQNPRRIFVRSGRRDRGLPVAVPLLLAAGWVAGILALDGRARPGVASAGTVSAPPARVAVVDGRTLRVGDAVVALDGVAAPPRGTVCPRAPDCASAATQALATLVQDRPVRCRVRAVPGGALHGTCDADGRNLNREVSAKVARAQTVTP
jgi:hypothetical protein